MSEATHPKPVAVAPPPFSLSQVLPWLIFAACCSWSPCTSSPLSRAPPRCSPAPASMSGSTTGATCSASPATEAAAMTSARNFLVRGLLAGLVAGLVAFGVAYVVGEPSVNAAIAIEESGGSGHDHADDPTASDAPPVTEVPRSLQSTAGLLTATLVAGVTLGGLVGVLSALPWAASVVSAYAVSPCPWPRSASSASTWCPSGLSAQPTSGRPSRHHRHPHRAVLHHGGHLGHCRRHGGAGRAQAGESLGRLVRDAGRHRRLSGGDRWRHRACCRPTTKCRPTSRPPSSTSSGERV